MLLSKSMRLEWNQLKTWQSDHLSQHSNGQAASPHIRQASRPPWLSYADAMNNGFHHDHRRRRGCRQLYTDRTICTFLILKGILSPTLRAAQGLFGSLPQLINVNRLTRVG
ncbi:hypothetical protein DBR19_14785 [Aeromonas sp. HMWF014]|nr:hypothetical protein DBR19_14785 [Aeromonas sp. HMWF014]